MRAAVLSDIHGNLPALEAVLTAVDAAEPDAVWCLGDLVGYGPWPNEVTELVSRRADLCLVGNHDLVALDTAGVDVEAFNPEAAEAARWTRRELTEDTRRFLESLEPRATRGEAGLYHASPRDPVWEYVLNAEAALAAFTSAPERVILVGHSHVALAFTLDGDRLDGDVAPAGTELELDARHLLNPGSVGQPRDGDPRAAWLLLDLAGRRARFERVEYDVQRAQDEIRERGLPGALADRLAVGL
jgi:diadenosine tetraphosphatase ApaH/serine/threonine PP2A family protein phosphatase